MATEADVSRDPIRHWRSAEFRARAQHWVQETLGQWRHEVRGDHIEHRVRFGSAVFTVPSAARRLWFKATNPGQGFEARCSHGTPPSVSCPWPTGPVDPSRATTAPDQRCGRLP